MTKIKGILKFNNWSWRLLGLKNALKYFVPNCNDTLELGIKYTKLREYPH